MIASTEPNPSRYDNVWIGLAEVVPVSTISDISSELEGCAGAVANTLCLADTLQQATVRIAETLEDIGFKLVVIHDLELFQERLETGFVDGDIVELASTIDLEHPVALHQFHAWAH